MNKDRKIILVFAAIWLVISFLLKRHIFLSITALILGISLIIDALFLKIPFFPYDIILSAISYDGLNWKKEKGVRIDARRKISHSGGVYYPFVMVHPKGFKMYYRGGCNYFDKIFTSVSQDGLKWNNDSELGLDFVKFGVQGVTSCSVMQEPGYQRFYLAGYDGRRWKIYSAISRDGLSCEIEEGIRVSNDSNFDSEFVKDPAVIKIRGSLRMYYLGNNGERGRILTAHSADGLTWHKDGICIEPEPNEHPRSLKAPYVYPFGDNLFRMYFTGGSQYPSIYTHILSAISNDGVNWKREEGIRLRCGGWFDRGEVLSPCVIQNNDLLRMYYSGLAVHILYPLTWLRYVRAPNI